MHLYNATWLINFVRVRWPISVRECTKNLCQSPLPVSTSFRTCAGYKVQCAHGVCIVLTRFVPMHMENDMCIEASPCGISNRARARFYASPTFREMYGGGGAPAMTTTRVHLLFSHATILVGKIFGFICIVIPVFPSQPFPFEQPNLYRDVRSSIGLYQSFHWCSIASPCCVWCQYLFALSQAPITGKFKSSGEKAADWSSSCIPSNTGQA